MLVILVHLAFLSAKTEPPANIEQQIDTLVQPLMDNEELVGLVVLVVDGEQYVVRTFGRLDDGPASPPPDIDTLFEIGSVTKTFTGLILARFVERGRCRLDDPVSKYLPSDLGPVRTAGHDVRLVDLATHSSGLPRLPTNLQPKNPGDPYADYDEVRLFQYLMQRSKLGVLDGLTQLLNPNAAMHSTDYGKYSYSNLGVGLLGHVLAGLEKTAYEELLRKEITGPLEMTDTSCSVAETRMPRLAPGHMDGDPVPSWHLDALAGAGAIRSTARDLVRYLHAHFDDAKSPFAAAIRLTHEPRIDASPALAVGLGWHILKDSKWITHDGGTGGYSSSVFCDPKGRKAIVVLGNQATSKVSLLGLALYQLLLGKEAKPIPTKPVVQLSPEQLRDYEGAYQLAPVARITIRVKDGKLRARLTGQPEFRIHAESEDHFFYRVVPAEIVFERDKSGRVERLRLLQNGRDLPAKKVADDAPPAINPDTAPPGSG